MVSVDHEARPAGWLPRPRRRGGLLVQSGLEQRLLLRPSRLPHRSLRFLAHELVRSRTRRLRGELLRWRYLLDRVRSIDASPVKRADGVARTDGRALDGRTLDGRAVHVAEYGSPFRFAGADGRRAGDDGLGAR